jgi:hypothetical protein
VKRLLLIGLGPLALIGGFLGAAVATGAGLPDPVATHWGSSGDPDGSFGLAGFVATVTAVGVAAWLAIIGQLRRRGQGELTAAPFAWAAMWFSVGAGALVLAANAGAATWQDARSVSLPMGLVPILAGGLGAVAAAALERSRSLRASVVDGGRPGMADATIGLRTGERAVWSRRATSPVVRVGALLAAGVLAAAALALGGPVATVLALLAIVLVPAMLVVSEVEVRVDARGLTVALGPFGLPSRRLPLPSIAGAESITVDPWQWGGWGYRKVPRRRGATAIVMRGGDGLRVVARDGRELVVTVPDAGTAAALLADLVRRGDGAVTA